MTDMPAREWIWDEFANLVADGRPVDARLVTAKFIAALVRYLDTLAARVAALESAPPRGMVVLGHTTGRGGKPEPVYGPAILTEPETREILASAPGQGGLGLTSIAAPDRESLGRLVHAINVGMADGPCSSWDDMSERHRETCRRIGERLYQYGRDSEHAARLEAERERDTAMRDAVREHARASAAEAELVKLLERVGMALALEVHQSQVRNFAGVLTGYVPEDASRYRERLRAILTGTEPEKGTT